MFGAAPNDVDDCDRPGASGIYILGNFEAGDTDEFDAHVIAHEFGHYFEDQFSRSDSIGGTHGGGDRLDLRLAFGEGWGNAYSAMSLNDPAYRDSQDGAAGEFGFDLETDNPTAEGWFSESSVAEVLWDVFDSAADSGDAVALGFPPIFSVMTGPQISTDAFTSIFTFASALKSANASSDPAISTLLSGEFIFGTDDFGSNETNDGGVQDVTPAYETAAFGMTPVFCTHPTAGTTDLNKLGNRKFFRFDVPPSGAFATLQVNGAPGAAGTSPATDPDVFVFREGELVALGEGVEEGIETLEQISLGEGVHIIEVYDFDLMGASTARCMTLSISGQ